MKTSAWLLPSVLVAAMAAGCGGGNNNGDGDGGTGGGDGGGGCTSSTACPTGQTCNTTTGLCETVGCTTHAECPQGSFCDNGTCAPNDTGGPCDGDSNCKPGETCIGGFCGCDGDQFVAEGVPPNVLIVLDRSGSMDEALGTSTKWLVAVDAVATLLANYGTAVRFGLVLYQRGNTDCAPGNVRVDVGDGTATMINTVLGNTNPNGFTPIGDTLDGLINYAGLEDTTRDNYILLLTDGSETCGGDGVTAVTNLFNETPQVKTFVVGFGSGVDATALNDMAQAGGTALPSGPPYYYQADDAASLNMAFDSIGAAVLSCTYALSGTPDIDTLHVFFDSIGVSRDTTHTDGWDYDSTSNQITFYGPACDSLKSGSVTDLVVVSGCTVPVP